MTVPLKKRNSSVTRIIRNNELTQQFDFAVSTGHNNNNNNNAAGVSSLYMESGQAQTTATFCITSLRLQPTFPMIQQGNVSPYCYCPQMTSL